MRNKHKFIFAAAVAIVLLFYRGGSATALEAEPNTEFEQSAFPAVEPEQVTEHAAEPDPEVEEIPENDAEQVPEESIESATESEPVKNMEPIEEMIPEQMITPALQQDIESEPVPDSVSNGTDLIRWLESHKNTGGTVKLADHVILDGDYSFCPSGMNMPPVVVDTDQYTITITGEIEFLSDHHLTFSGQPDGKGIFCVAEKGMLSMQGIAVESGQGALWQEEGAGLVIADCHIAGSIHYAETPFVVDQKTDSVCVVVEKNQTLHDVLPTSIECTVNRQGQVSHSEPVPVTWNLAGTEKQQEQRRRFQVQGSFLQAAYAEPVSCTVVYNDYPLTFTEVRASLKGSIYMFSGWYTKPEDALPITVVSEYSFNGENWFTDEEKFVTDTADSFTIIVQPGQFGTAVNSDIYIRLRWNHNGTEYFSNVLCYAAGNLECAEDIGGSRGGGTSIVDPPGPPQENDPPQNAGDTPSTEQPVQNADRNTGSNTEPGDAGSGASSNTDQTKSSDGNTGLAAAGAVQSLHAEQRAGQPQSAVGPNTGTEQPQSAERPDTGTEQPQSAEHPDTRTERLQSGALPNTGTAQEVFAAASAYGKNSAYQSRMNGQEMRLGIRDGMIVCAAGFVLLAVAAGIVCFGVRSRRRRSV